MLCSLQFFVPRFVSEEVVKSRYELGPHVKDR